MTLLSLRIAGVRIDLRGSGAEPAALARYRAFTCSEGPADWTVELGPATFEGSVLPGRSFALRDGRWRPADAPDAAWLDASAPIAAAQLDRECLLVDALLRAAVARTVLASGGLLLHAATVVVDGRAHVCPARSGSGKSTLARAAGHPLCDEVSVLRPAATGFVAHATPWWTSRGGSAPVACVHELVWGAEEVTILPGTALRRLVTNLVLPIDGPGEQRRALAVAAEIARSVPYARLAFRPDTAVDALLLRGGWQRGR